MAVVQLKQRALIGRLFRRRVREFVRDEAISIFRTIRSDSRRVGGSSGSPVASGAFSASWRLTLNTPSEVEVAKPVGYRWSRNASRVVSLPSLSITEAVLNRYKPGDTIYISSGQPYGNKLENGYSTKAPNGVTRPSIAAARSVSGRLASKVRRIT